MTISPLRQYISQLTVEQLEQIVEDYETWEREGAVGDCLLREIALSFSNGEEYLVILMMQTVTFEVFRIFYYLNRP